MIEFLTELSLVDQAQELDTWLEEILPDRARETHIGVNTVSLNKRKIFLPTKCPSCGGRVHPDEIEWVDEQMVECSFVEISSKPMKEISFSCLI
ncbi:MAG: hypothetical protein MUO76_12785 [Anaerolineaceae bacterium]|nr:hypothetical protein [Anaerolineaceae bacterium]